MSKIENYTTGSWGKERDLTADTTAPGLKRARIVVTANPDNPNCLDLSDPATVERLAAALAAVTAQRGYIDLGGMDLAFGGGKPFRDIAAAIITALREPLP